ncbi:MAG TPA: right-handed parallel beta-helix repeat-containing protein [Solirubrobacterales bacterium]
MLVHGVAGGGRLKMVCAALAVLACGLVALLAPAAASATEIIVNSTGDQADETPGSGGCKTSLATCTLRAAIEEANFAVGTDEVLFNPFIFSGELVDTIALGSALPTITDTLFLEGHRCATAAGVPGPCVGVSGPSGGFALRVEADNTWIRGLAITGALTGISVINGTTGFVAQYDWLGVKLDGTNGANNTGIFLDPGSNSATIGGVLPTVRNVFAYNNNEGLDLEGASSAQIRGNYFGVAPDGSSQAANNKNIEITDSTAGAGFKAMNNEIGGGLGGEELGTPACDGACDVISGASNGIDLSGSGPNEAPASGPTAIHGNYIGLDATGTAAVPNSNAGILVGKAAKTTIGGPGSSDANHINGGVFGVVTGGAPDLMIARNLVGLGGDGTTVIAPPTGQALSVSSVGITDVEETATIVENTISMAGGVGIVAHSTGAAVVGNQISGSAEGISIYGDNGTIGNLIADNTIEGAEENGIVIENNLNELLGNGIFGSGLAGIRIESPGGVLPATGNVIGGDVASDDNVISGSGGDGIEIETLEEDENEVARNHGQGNAGLFIDLGGNGPGNQPGGPNGGIQPPTFATSFQSSAGGTAQPGATIRVFRKAVAEAGELESFLSEAVADGSGNWKATYPAATPVGTIVAATQTSVAGGTSELSTATAAIDPVPPKCPGDPTCLPSSPPASQPSAGSPPLAPQTSILKTPKARSAKTTAKFKFKSSVSGSSFQCKLDKGKFKKCRSPQTYKKLKLGKHVFQVRAVGPTGLADTTPAKRKFTITD